MWVMADANAEVAASRRSVKTMRDAPASNRMRMHEHPPAPAAQRPQHFGAESAPAAQAPAGLGGVAYIAGWLVAGCSWHNPRDRTDQICCIRQCHHPPATLALEHTCVVASYAARIAARRAPSACDWPALAAPACGEGGRHMAGWRDGGDRLESSARLSLAFPPLLPCPSAHPTCLTPQALTQLSTRHGRPSTHLQQLLPQTPQLRGCVQQRQPQLLQAALHKQPQPLHLLQERVLEG